GSPAAGTPGAESLAVESPGAESLAVESPGAGSLAAGTPAVESPGRRLRRGRGPGRPATAGLARWSKLRTWRYEIPSRILLHRGADPDAGRYVAERWRKRVAVGDPAGRRAEVVRAAADDECARALRGPHELEHVADQIVHAEGAAGRGVC